MAHGFELEDRLDTVRSWRHRDNRLVVLTCPTPVAPVASFCVVYRVGSRSESSGHTGATHLLEHLMFKGTERFCREKGTEAARVLQRVGAAFNATTWLDRTNYFETLPVEHLPLAAELEADRMRNARIRDQDLATERTVVLNEMERGENEPFDLLMHASFAHAFLEHPYHHPTIGWRWDVETVSAAELRRYYDHYYHPDNAVVVVAGDVAEEAALAEVERHFGAIPPAPEPIAHEVTREGGQRGERRFAVHRAGELGWLALSWHTPAALHADQPALSVLAQVLSEGVTSRLYQKLVETNRCLGVHAFAWQLHDPGLLQVYATLAPGVGHVEVEEVIRDEVRSLRSAPPAPDELARAKVQVRTDLAFHRESPSRIVAGLSEAVAAGDWRLFLREMELVEAVTAADVSRVAATHLGDLNLTVGRFVAEGNGHGGVVAEAPQPRPCFLRRPFAERVALRDLPGGARLAVLANPHAPTVTVAGSLLAGRAFAGVEERAVPAVTALMLERGTVRHDRLELARELEDHGLELGVETSSGAPSLVTFAGQGLASELPRLAQMLVELLRWPTFPADQLERVREHLLGELAQEREDTFARALGSLTRHLYPSAHPHYRREVGAREAELRSLERGQLEAFHRRAYGPASLLLAVVGDVEAESTADLISGLLDEWEGGMTRPPVVPDPAPAVPADERVDIPDRPNLDVVLGHAATLRRSDPDWAAAVLANSCLGQSTLTSRLGVEVRDTAGLTYGIFCRFFGTLQVPGPWATALGVAGVNLERAIALCRRVIGDYVVAGPSEEELNEERLAQSGAYRVGLATNAGVARELVGALSAGLPVAFLDEYPERLLAVTVDEAVAAVRRHLHPERLVVAVAGSLPQDGDEVTTTPAHPSGEGLEGKE